MGFEKMGLPPKPYEKGKDWTPDSTNCQGCNATFTLFNRKHHCRRCGGLFCNYCTLDRLYLRGQGDAPARVCKPCKQIDEAARFELRYGKSKIPRGVSKVSSSSKDDGTDTLVKQLLEKPQDEEVNVESILASVAESDRDDHELHSPSQEKAPASPTQLHEQAQEEKKRYNTLKKQGKDIEALKAFKRAKELERQAEALEKEIKHQRRVSASSSKISPSKGEDPGSPDARVRKPELGDNKKKRRTLSEGQGNEKPSAPASERDDLLNELKVLGWSDKDIREADRKPAAKSEEQLLAELVAEVRPKTSDRAATSAAPGPINTMSTQIMAHKRQALVLKREGRLVEAKDELRKAKILEKQAEEMALLGPAEGEDEASDEDEVDALMRALEREGKLECNLGMKGAFLANPEDFGIFSTFVDDDDDAQVEVDNDDFDDPEMAAALRAMGFVEEDSHVLERPSKPQSRVTKLAESTVPDLKQQIFAQKSKALAFKREGKIAEAQAELAGARKLEQQLENVGSAIAPSPLAQAPAKASVKAPAKVPKPAFDVGDSNVQEDEEKVEVTDQDMRDPEMMAVLRAMGFGDDEPATSHEIVSAKPNPIEEASLKQQILGIKRKYLALKREGRIDEACKTLRSSKVLEQQLEDLQAVIQRQEEMPAIIKQSREVRRGVHALPALSGLPNSDDEGREEEDVEVDNADLIDPDIAAALAAIGWQEDPAENSTNLPVTVPKKDEPSPVASDPLSANLKPAGEPQAQEAEAKKVDEVVQTGIKESEIKLSPLPTASNKTKSELQRELLGRKRQALALKREGKSEEARIELWEAKIIEQQLAELNKGLAVVSLTVAESKPGAAVQMAQPPPQQSSKHPLKQEPEPSRPVYLDDLPVDEVEVTEDDMQDPVMLAALANLGLLGEKEGPAPSKSTPVVGKSSTTGKKEPGIQPQTEKGREKMENLLDFDWGVPHRHAKKTGKEIGQVVKGSQKDEEANPFEGEYGEIGQTMDLVPPLLGSGGRSDSQVPSKPLERPPFGIPSSKPVPDAAVNSTQNLQQEILALKKKALALKREGKVAEAKEELRKAKLLERQSVQQGSRTVTTTVTAAGTETASTQEKIKEVSSAAFTPSKPEPPIPVKSSPPSKSSPGHKEEKQKQVRQTKDRMKLQQESLAHKRKAMGLRRQGKIEEADAEYELAKELEKQMEDLDPMHGKEDLGDVAGVDDLLDPQLLAALKGIGFREGDLAGHKAPTVVMAQPGNDLALSSKGTIAPSKLVGGGVETERKQLEEQIRAQKLEAVQLKRAGKQAEALVKFRGVKLLEKNLLALTS